MSLAAVAVDQRARVEALHRAQLAQRRRIRVRGRSYLRDEEVVEAAHPSSYDVVEIPIDVVVAAGRVDERHFDGVGGLLDDGVRRCVDGVVRRAPALRHVHRVAGAHQVLTARGELRHLPIIANRQRDETVREDDAAGALREGHRRPRQRRALGRDRDAHRGVLARTGALESVAPSRPDSRRRRRRRSSPPRCRRRPPAASGTPSLASCHRRVGPRSPRDSRRRASRTRP